MSTNEDINKVDLDISGAPEGGSRAQNVKEEQPQ